MQIDQLGSAAAEAAQSGQVVVEFGGGHWCSFPPGGQPERAYWATALARSQWQRRADDLAAIGRLDVGQSHRAVRGYHPRHGESFATVTRVA